MRRVKVTTMMLKIDSLGTEKVQISDSVATKTWNLSWIRLERLCRRQIRLRSRSRNKWRARKRMSLSSISRVTMIRMKWTRDTWVKFCRLGLTQLVATLKTCQSTWNWRNKSWIFNCRRMLAQLLWKRVKLRRRQRLWMLLNSRLSSRGSKRTCKERVRRVEISRRNTWMALGLVKVLALLQTTMSRSSRARLRTSLHRLTRPRIKICRACTRASRMNSTKCSWASRREIMIIVSS